MIIFSLNTSFWDVCGSFCIDFFFNTMCVYIWELAFFYVFFFKFYFCEIIYFNFFLLRNKLLIRMLNISTSLFGYVLPGENKVFLYIRRQYDQNVLDRKKQKHFIWRSR